MQPTNRRYRHFEQYCLRNPLFSIKKYAFLTEDKTIDFATYKSIWQDNVVQEALFLATPSLFTTLDKYFKQENPVKDVKLQAVFLKYVSRMSSRCTPFGLFTGCSVGTFTRNTDIVLQDFKNFNRQTRFDMNFLVALSMHLSNEPNIKKQLLFYPNTSIYKAGNHLRYVEYTYQQNRRIHNLEAVSNTDYLQEILANAKTGKTLAFLAILLVSNEINLAEATVFIDELVSNQLLVSELEPSVSGEDLLQQLIKNLQHIKGTTPIVIQLQKLAKQLQELDTTIGNKVTTYYQIAETVKTLLPDVELKHLFQTDLFATTSSNQLDGSISKSAKEGLVLLNKMSVRTTNTNLDNFRKAFVKRYEQDEVPLTLTLDIEMGIGYLQHHHLADDTHLLDDLFLPNKANTTQSLSWNKTQNILHKKLLINKGNYTLLLTDNDFKDFSEDWSDLSDTISGIAEVLFIEGKEMVYLNSVGDSSAVNLLGRFSDGSNEIHQLSKTIIAKETELQANKIRAEIVHLPQARTGNILKRPQFRDFEIPYLAKSTVALEYQLDINDLMLSVKGNKIILRSKKHNKEVLPHLSNAHNYSNGLPIYHFLCDLQTQNKRSLYFSWGNASMNQSFLPRVVYKNVILHKASWIIDKNDIITFTKLTDDTLLTAITTWRKELKMPKWVQLVESDNTLLINMENTDSIQMFLQSIKKKKQFILEEFLFANNGVVQSEQGYYTNQVILSFYKTS